MKGGHDATAGHFGALQFLPSGHDPAGCGTSKDAGRLYGTPAGAAMGPMPRNAKRGSQKPMSSSTFRHAATAVAATLFSAALLAGCATPPPDSDPEAVADFQQLNDPLEPMNRSVFEFNQAIDRAMFKPVARAYHDYVPDYGRERVRDLLHNWSSPLVFANDVLQGEPDRAMQTLMRFAFNTGWGALGLFDVAGAGGIPYHEEDLGQTFAVWGVGEGPYLVLPILGPSNPRDTVGMVAEWVVDPVDYRLGDANNTWAVYSRSGVSGLNKREENLEALDDIERNALDVYASIRALYRQHRQAEIRNKTDVKKLPKPGLTALPSGTQISQETN